MHTDGCARWRQLDCLLQRSRQQQLCARLQVCPVPAAPPPAPLCASASRSKPTYVHIHAGVPPGCPQIL